MSVRTVYHSLVGDLIGGTAWWEDCLGGVSELDHVGHVHREVALHHLINTW